MSFTKKMKEKQKRNRRDTKKMAKEKEREKEKMIKENGRGKRLAKRLHEMQKERWKRSINIMKEML